jgi:glycine/D-amino acid oxidase-like deaminating enzyme
VVGGGVFGTTAALELRSRGYRVTLIDRGRIPHPHASSTDVSKVIRMDYGSDVFYHELAEAAIEGWDRWNSDWPQPLYHTDQFLVLSSGGMKPGGFEYESHHVLRDRGYEVERLDGQSLSQRFPAWNGDRYADGYLSPRGGWAESGAVVSRLHDLCMAAGVQTRRSTFSGLVSSGSRVRGIRTQSGESLPADQVLICAGAWTPTLLPWMRAMLRTIAQPVLHFGVADPDEFRGDHFPPFAADIAGSGWYGFPALDDGRVKLGHHGAGREVTPDDRGEVGADHVEMARAFLAESIPGLANARVVDTRVCLYCDSHDGDLFIDRDPDREGLTVAAGGSGHAFKFAPLIGSIIADALEGVPNQWGHRFSWRLAGREASEEARLQIPKGPLA